MNTPLRVVALWSAVLLLVVAFGPVDAYRMRRDALLQVSEQSKANASPECPSVDTGIHLILQYFVMDKERHKDIKPELIEERQAEYTQALANNLAHKHVAKVHVMAHEESDIHYVQQLIDQRKLVDECNKLNLFYVKKQMTYRDAFQYAQEKLTDKIAMVINADIYLGEGFEHLTKDMLRKKAFALSRYQKDDCHPKGQSPAWGTMCVAPQASGGASFLTLADSVQLGHDSRRSILAAGESPSLALIENRADITLSTLTRLSSHDAFMFLPPLPEKIVKSVDHIQNFFGSENIVVAAFRTAGYAVENPCLTLKIYHHHCTDLRPWNKPDEKGLVYSHYKGDADQGTAQPTALPANKA